jgi:hypothetical protein
MPRRHRYVRSPLILFGNTHAAIDPESGVIPVSCWCERRIVAVDRDALRAGRTASCGHPRCRAPHAIEEDRALGF